MSDYYSKLGNILSEALENGQIPKNEEKNQKKASETQEFLEKDKKAPELNTENLKYVDKDEKIRKKLKKEEIPTGEVIKMHKYTNLMHIPQEILQILTTLDIAYPYTWKKITKRYYELLKKLHPDSAGKNKNTIHNFTDVDNFRHLTINQLQDMYKILDRYFNCK